MMSIYCLVAYALSPLGYVFTLIAAGNATVLTSSATFVLCAFANGFFGIKRSQLSESVRWLLNLSPGYPAFMLVSYGAALGEPLATKRWAIIRQLWYAQLVPTGDDGYVTEFGDDPESSGRHVWAEQCMLNLFLIGLVLRVLTLVLFYFRSSFTFISHVLVRFGKVGEA